MLQKCANPECGTSFRKLGSGKLFAFESMKLGNSAHIRSDKSNAKTDRSHVLFWLCDACSLTLTIGLDARGQVTLRSVPAVASSCQCVPLLKKTWVQREE